MLQDWLMQTKYKPSITKVLLKPNEACALIVDGRIGDVLTETLLKSMAGGFTRWIGDKIGVTANDRRLLFAMTALWIIGYHSRAKLQMEKRLLDSQI